MCFQCDQLVGKLDEIVRREPKPETQWPASVWSDILLAGNEAVGAVLAQRRNQTFIVRSLVAWNTSDARIKVEHSSAMIPPTCSAFVSRVYPPTDILKLIVDAAPSHSGECFIYLTQELLDPTAGLL